jgi:hypothetical protein
MSLFSFCLLLVFQLGDLGMERTLLYSVPGAGLPPIITGTLPENGLTAPS